MIHDKQVVTGWGTIRGGFFVSVRNSSIQEGLLTLRTRFFTPSKLAHTPMKEGTPTPSTEASVFSLLPNWNTPKRKKAPLPLLWKPPLRWKQKIMIFMGFFMKIYVLLIFLETITRRKKFLKKEMCISIRCTTSVSNILKKFAYWLRETQKTMIFMDFYGFTMKINQPPIVTIIFVISVSKYVNVGSLKKIGGFSYSELYHQRKGDTWHSNARLLCRALSFLLEPCFVRSKNDNRFNIGSMLG